MGMKMKSRFALALVAAACLLPSVAAAGDPIIVLRPPGVSLKAGVLPNDAFAAPVATPNGDPDALIFQSIEWDYDWSAQWTNDWGYLKREYLHFNVWPTITASTSLSAGGLYDFSFPAGYKPPNNLPVDQTCNAQGAKGITSKDFFTESWGNIVNGVYQTHVIDDGWHMSRITAKKVGTMNLLMQCRATTAVQYPDGTDKIVYGSVVKLVLRVTP
jgi:hypothetical protein